MRKLSLWVLFLSIVLFLSMRLSKEIHAQVLHLSDLVKVGVLNLNNNVANVIIRHFDQAKQIKRLNNDLRDKEQIAYELDFLKSEYNALLSSINTYFDVNIPEIKLARTLSYVNINDYTKVWLESKNNGGVDNSIIYGLVMDNKVAGIARYENNRLIGYLNGDEKCSYSVIVGKNNLSGVAKYDLKKGFIVDYIPLFPAIEIGDLVYTSGYDGIFYSGIFVGEVIGIEKRQGYQIAILKVAISNVSRLYWLIDIGNENILNNIYSNDNNSTDLNETNFKDLININ